MIKEAVKAASLKEAADLKAGGMMYLGGGTLINWAPSGLNPERVVLLEGLVPGEIDKKDGALEIGAFCSLTGLIEDDRVPGPLRTAAGFIPSRNIRNMATLGGSIAAGRADSYIIPALIALKAKVDTVEDGIMDVYDYVNGKKTSLIQKVILPELSGTCAVDRSVRSSAAYPSAVTAVYCSDDECIIALGAVADSVMRFPSIEADIVSGKLSGEEDVFNAVYNAVDPEDGLKDSGAYKRYIAATMIARSVQSCRKGGA